MHFVPSILFGIATVIFVIMSIVRKNQFDLVPVGHALVSAGLAVMAWPAA